MRIKIEEIKNIVFNSKDYSFLSENINLKDKIILLGLGGSYAYGTNTDDSDIDLRGIALNKKEEILTNVNFEQFVNKETDTTVYSLNKIISLLLDCNPNTIELLGLKKEHYLYINQIGQELLDNKEMFLSKKAIYSFGGYATAQLRRLDNKSVRNVSQKELEAHILNSIKNAFYTFPDKYFYFEQDSIKLYLDDAVQKDFEKEIFMDINLSHYPLRDYKGMWSEMNNIVKDYSKIGKRNKHAIEHDKLGKHMMHLVRLYLMCLDILNKGEIITYREDDHDLLMSIRNGDFLDSDMRPKDEFYTMVDDFEDKLKIAAERSSLPDKPDYKRINKFLCTVNEKVVRGDIVC